MLEFRVLAEKQKGDAEKIDACRAAFAKDGPLASGDKDVYRWFQLREPAFFLKTKNLAGEFARIQQESPLILERRREDVFVLAHVGEGYIMTRAPGVPEWSVQSARVSRSTHGYVGIEVALDPRAAALLGKMTETHGGRILGVFLDDQAIMYANIQDVIKRNIMITGSFSASEAEKLARLLQPAISSSKPTN